MIPLEVFIILHTKDSIKSNLMGVYSSYSLAIKKSKELYPEICIDDYKVSDLVWHKYQIWQFDEKIEIQKFTVEEDF